jgi:hypothetical protein
MRFGLSGWRRRRGGVVVFGLGLGFGGDERRRRWAGTWGRWSFHLNISHHLNKLADDLLWMDIKMNMKKTSDYISRDEWGLSRKNGHVSKKLSMSFGSPPRGRCGSKEA